MMRADPDVIMVGEIRDRETAQIAVEAALTGHLVLSTLHTNDAPTAITRLVEMGIEPFLVASAHRLRRRPAPGPDAVPLTARRGRSSAPRSCATTASTPATTSRPTSPSGCARCGGSGYKGRVGLYEVMPVTEEIRTLAIERASADRIAEVAVRDGMRRLREDGLDKVRHGVTSIAEVARVTSVGS